MAIRTKKISTLIESQLPSFIVDEYPLFSKFVEKYYEAQESSGQPLDIANNLLEYNDINLYEQNLLRENNILDVTITDSDSTIVLQDATSFPEKNGYIRIDDEIIFYSTRTDTTLNECSRGVSGNTTLGDLYEESAFVTTDSAPHNSGAVVHNVSNLFLYALIKSFESQYLASFPEKYLKGDVDKRTLIKNIRQFYKTKGTSASIRFVFNSIISNTTRDVPETYNPKDFTYKSSTSDWINIYALKCKVVSGNPKDLIGIKIVQEATEEYGYADAVVDNVFADGTSDSEQIFNIVLAPETVNGTFGVSTKTKLRKPLSGTATSGNRIDVFSTIGWDLTGLILIGDETIEFDDKTVDQFIIKKRAAASAGPHVVDTPVYKPVVLKGSNVTLLTFGVVYNLLPSDAQPYSAIGDKIQVSNPGFETSDSKIVQTGTNTTRWLLNTGANVDVPTLPAVETFLNEVSTNVSSILADDQYYYIASSSYPSHKILDGSTVNEELLDQKLLRIIRKQATRTTEKYLTPKSDVGIALNGVPFYGYKDPESVRFGKLEEIKIDKRGTGYTKPPFVLVDQVPNKARAILTGQVVESIIVDTNDVFPRTPDITITSGRNASVRAIITGGKVTSLVIDNPGEFYSAPPLIRIRDNAGRGRFAEYLSVVDTDGKITDFTKIGEGNFYNQDTVVVDVIPVGNSATGIPLLKEWNFNRFNKIEDELDTEYGYIFPNYNNVLEYGYGYAANPKSLRVALNDNISSSGTEPATKTHSPIIGFAYDGNPIYGPFGHQDPLDATSSIVRMTSGYSINGNRSNGPSLTNYPLGTFVNDYTYTHKSGTLDQNNGRFTVTPDFPKGTYAYFITIDSNQVPQYPYLLGENFYSLPVDSNYNSNISQNDVPKNARKFYEAGMQRNGGGVIAQIAEVKQGNVEQVTVVDSSANFSINSQVYFDNRGTEGSEVESIVKSVKGKGVSYLESKEDKVVKLTTIQSAYLFADDTLNQPSSGATGSIVGTVKNDNIIVLRNVNGVFDETGTFSATIKTFIMLLDQRSSYTKGATLSLTDGVNAPIAKGIVLEGTAAQNTVQIKVIPIQDNYEDLLEADWDYGDWLAFTPDYFLQSDDLFNTSGTKLVRLTSLSDGLNPFEVNQSVALIETAAPHGLGIGDKVDIDINPDDATTTKTYYLRKRLYQVATLIPPNRKTSINFTGIGRFEILNGGADYTPDTYTSVSLTGGSGTGATATFTVSAEGIVSDMQLQDAGSGYARGDYLGVADEDLVRSGASQSTARFALYVGHVGVPAGGTKVTVDSTDGFSDNDLIKIGDEILQIESITGSDLFVSRGKEGTDDVDHFDGQEVELYNPRFNFTNNFQIFDGSNSGYIQSYDPVTHKIKIVYDYSTLTSTASKVVLSSSFFDSSNPRRLVSIKSAENVQYNFEFSEDNSTFVPNPNINIQEFYKYKFDTSHSSLTGTYFDISPSNNYNLNTVEKLETTILPGNAGSFTDVKFGFGYRNATNNYQTKVGTDFTNFYYFDKKNVVNSGGALFKIVTDPLQGSKTLIYVTPNRFVYDVASPPLWDGSGSITYTTTGQFAIGKIDTTQIINLGLNYKKVPVIIGVDPSAPYRATADLEFDIKTNTIIGVNITNKGSNYVNPKIVITNGDGVDASFNIICRNGEIASITVDNAGKGYTFKPDIIIIEGDVEAYAESTSIGVPKSVKITTNGGAFHLDKTVSSTFSSNFIVAVKNINGKFSIGEIVIQKLNGVEVFRGVVTEWRLGSNLLKISNTQGILRENISIESLRFPVDAIVSKVFVSTFSEEINSFYDNLGYYKSDRGRLGVSNQKLQDSFFYQDYSYVIKSETSIEQWRDLIKSTTHPAGFKLFGQVDVESTASSEMPVEMPKASHFSVIQLWDPDKNKITVENTRRTVTQIVQKVENQRIRKGFGTAAPSEFLFNENRAFEFTLAAPFDGYYDTDGRLQGTKSFQILNNGTPFFPASEKGLIVTLDGVIQEPGVAFTISNDQIVFSTPPLGPGTKLTGSGGAVTAYKGVTFYGKVFQFKDAQYNTQYLKKIRNIFQRNGTWIDAANQIERNVDFIINEAIGFGKATYSTLDWATKQDDYERDIRAILDAYQHDLRFGGNIKIINYTEIFNSSDIYQYIQNNKTNSIAIFEYVSRLAKLAIRNWDWIDVNISYVQGSNMMTVSSTKNLAIGLFVSSGRAFPVGTKIVSIDSDTQITLNNSALANSGGGGGAPSGTTSLSGTASTATIATSTGAVDPGNTFTVPPGVTVSVPVSFSGTTQAAFSWSGQSIGMFYKAGQLIALNRAYIVSESLTWAQTQYPGLNWGSMSSKCGRDIGLMLDAYVYSLKFGGNEKIVDAAQLYYQKKQYPYGEELYYISGQLTETINTFNYAKDLMIQAMRNQLPGTDPDALIDSVSPVCAEVESTLNTYHGIVNTILTEGRGLVEKTKQNPNKSGNWTQDVTYSNYNILGDPLLPVEECTTVISAMDALHDNLSDVIREESVTRSLPDYIDGETKEFELYWDDNTNVDTDKDENLFITLNAVLQRPKYTEGYPLEDSYFIDRTVIPNKIKFDVAPIWDQDFSAKTIGEPTAVEKVVGIGVGNYKRLTIDYNLVNNVRNGPFLILDVEDFTVQNIESEDSMYVFVDGVLQRKGYSYEISGPNITFNVPIKKEMKVDIRYLYGRDVGQVLNIYDYAPDTYFSQGILQFSAIESTLDTLLKYTWMDDSVGTAIHVWQQRGDGTYNVIGEISNPIRNGVNTVSFNIKCQNPVIESGIDFTFAVKGKYNRNITISVSTPVLSFKEDEFGRKLLKDDNGIWSGTILGKTYKQPFVYLSNNDKIRVEGEEGFRRIKKLPSEAISKDGRDGQQTTNNIFGTVSIESYTGITRGEGLSVVATIKNGKVLEVAIQNAGSGYSDAIGVEIPEFTETIGGVDVKKFGLVIDITTTGDTVTNIKIIEGGENYDIGDVIAIPGGTDGTFIINDVLDGYVSNLTWNQRSYDPITQPTAYQYYTPPVLKFESLDGNGGGARANVLVSKGQVISVDLIDSGFEYTTAPKIIATRRFDILTERDVGVSLINIGINPYIETFGLTAISVVSEIDESGLNSISGISSVFVQVAGDAEIVIEREFNLKEVEVFSIGGALDPKRDYIEFFSTEETSADDVKVIDVFAGGTLVSAAVQDIVSLNSISTISKAITTTVQVEIENNSIANYNYFENAAYLQVDFNINDSIAYIGDTTKFAPNGKLLIGNEIVFYNRKLSDRFIQILRGYENTTEQDWIAGTYLRQIEDISVISAGIVTIESESDFTMVAGGVNNTQFERSTQREVSAPADFSITREAFEIVITPPPGGAVDGYQETAFINDPVQQRNQNKVDLLKDSIGNYTVTKRNGTIIIVRNELFGTNDYVGKYLKSNVGPTIGNWQYISFDDGTANVSGFSIGDITQYFPALTIGDFTDRADSSYTKSGDKFNLGNPSIQNPVTSSLDSGTIPSVLNAQKTSYFPVSGYLFTGQGSVLQYTGKTINSFTGCTLVRGPNTIVNGDELVPFPI